VLKPPGFGDPRLRVSAVILTIQVLGQAVLGFKVSVAQIAFTILLCAGIEVAATYRQRRVLKWPASAILTGNGIALILRAAGTRAGDWWSLNGIEYFALAAVLAMGSKFLIRPGGRHVYNPSNLGLVLIFILVGPPRVYPQYLWWGAPGLGVVLAYLVIVAGAIWVLSSLRMIPLAVTFLVSFAALVSALAISGDCLVAIWHVGPICGAGYWSTIVTSPEVLVFALFMMSDPRTAPPGQRARLGYALLAAVIAAAFIHLQLTEYGIKVALLASLVIACAVPRVLDGAVGGVRNHAGPRLGNTWGAARAVHGSGAIIALVLGVATYQGVVALSVNEALVNLEGGAAGSTPAAGQ